MKVLAVSGYKPQELNIFRPDSEEVSYIIKTIEKRLQSFLSEGLEWVVVSGQPGVEQWAAEAAIRLKEEWPDLKLAVLPAFMQQESKWPEHAQARYHRIISQADFTDVISKREYENPGQLRTRNDFIVMKTDALLLLYDTEQPGTPRFYLEAAERRSAKETYPVYWITPEDLQVTVEELADRDYDPFIE
ncbi:SLOG family protein [Bacillus piscicola]|uniref:SLOG family protein n=1 Tax=Bacillus piscicola TaxID=1632684 RepID=UPI001F088D4B|nr:DUF1273 domain-containing protein [Bacillus piscicola]